MAGIFNGPPRGGTRGGRSEFKWEDVKASTDREYYLGHSVKALAGRWQKGKDVYWYTKDKDGGNSETARQHELQLVKQREEELMMEALGMKPKAPRHVQTSNRQNLDSIEMRKLLSAGDQEDDARVPGQRVVEEERVRGLGYSAGGYQGGESRREILGGVGVSGADAYGGRPPLRTEREREHGRRSRSDKAEKHEEHERDGRHRRRERQKRHKKDISRKSSRRRSRSRSRERSHRRRREHREFDEV